MSRTEISWIDANGQMTIPGMIEDRSVSGLGIQVAKRIPVGTSVKVNFRNQIVAAVVRRCVREGFGTLIGVSFEQDTGTNPPVPSAQEALGSEQYSRSSSVGLPLGRD
jgi:hypothetical protein